MKPVTKQESKLREKFAREDEMPHELDRDVRVDKRIWKRASAKHARQTGNKELKKQLEE